MHVGQPRLPRVAVLSDILLVVLTGQTLAAGSPTPDEAVREYLAGIAASDAERILGASAIDEMAEGHRLAVLDERPPCGHRRAEGGIAP